MTLEFIALNRHYSEWKWIEKDTGREYYNNDEIFIDPLKLHLFTGDIVSYEGGIISSHYMQKRQIPGVLILDGKTYGRPQGNNSKNKLLYKCIPNDIALPSFLIQYENRTCGFSKKPVNIYVTFCIKEWSGKHPTGTIFQSFGNVDKLNGFNEYQMHCKEINHSIHQFNIETNKTIKQYDDENNIINDIRKKYPQIENRLEANIMTIDPIACKDFDDAIGLTETSSGYIISIYIANVAIWMDFLNIWKHFSERISTIYLPDKKYPMLPSILSEKLCSLQENEPRIAFVLDLFIEDNKIVDIEYHNALIKVKQNYIYEDDKLIANREYKILFDITKQLKKTYPYLDAITDSHDVVAYYMILMNHKCAETLEKYNAGLFRVVEENDKLKEENIPDNIKNFARILQCGSGSYRGYDERGKHNMIAYGLDIYVHITSPIRRFVDLLNMITIQQNLDIIEISDNANEFLNKWTQRLDYINTSMRSIKRLQAECYLLEKYMNNKIDLNKAYKGYLFDKEKAIKDEIEYKYNVYLPELKIMSEVFTNKEFENYSEAEFTIHLFTNEFKFKRKARLQLIID